MPNLGDQKAFNSTQNVINHIKLRLNATFLAQIFFCHRIVYKNVAK